MNPNTNARLIATQDEIAARTAAGVAEYRKIKDAREIGRIDGYAATFDPSESYGLDETLAYQEGYRLTFRG